MSNTIGWGKGSVNNIIGWGQGATNNTNGWGSIYDLSYSPETDLDGDLDVLTVDTTFYKADSTLLTADIYYI